MDWLFMSISHHSSTTSLVLITGEESINIDNVLKEPPLRLLLLLKINAVCTRNTDA
jgi:hypothetical protein